MERKHSTETPRQQARELSTLIVSVLGSIEARKLMVIDDLLTIALEDMRKAALGEGIDAAVETLSMKLLDGTESNRIRAEAAANLKYMKPWLLKTLTAKKFRTQSGGKKNG